MTDGTDAQRELHEITGALDVLFTLREEFAQWLEEAQSEERKEELANVYRHIEAMEQDLASAGFQAEFRDITDNVAEACRLDSPRRREVIRRHAPLFGRVFLKRQLENYAAIEGSAKFAAFAEGRRTYLMTAASKAA